MQYPHCGPLVDQPQQSLARRALAAECKGKSKQPTLLVDRARHASAFGCVVLLCVVARCCEAQALHPLSLMLGRGSAATASTVPHTSCAIRELFQHRRHLGFCRSCQQSVCAPRQRCFYNAYGFFFCIIAQCSYRFLRPAAGQVYGIFAGSGFIYGCTDYKGSETDLAIPEDHEPRAIGRNPVLRDRSRGHHPVRMSAA
jgi:hypothetical protein